MLKTLCRYNTAVVTAVFLTACSQNMYMPEAHTYSNEIKKTLLKENICTAANCTQFVKMRAFGWKIKKFEKGSITLDILGINSIQVANKIIDSCKLTNTTLKKDVPITINLYNTVDITNDSKPIMSNNCS